MVLQRPPRRLELLGLSRERTEWLRGGWGDGQGRRDPTASGPWCWHFIPSRGWALKGAQMQKGNLLGQPLLPA